MDLNSDKLTIKKRHTRKSYTKGEWLAVGAWVEHANDKVADICNCNPDSMNQSHLGRSYDEICANACLIAAAPNLLKALETIIKSGEIKHSSPSVTLAKRAIDKARGILWI